jgi:hypothetical protein
MWSRNAGPRDLSTHEGLPPRIPEEIVPSDLRIFLFLDQLSN